MRSANVACWFLATAQVGACAAPDTGCAAPRQWLPYRADRMPEHRVVLAGTLRADGTISWGDGNISEQELAAYLERTRSMEPAPYLVLQYEADVSCAQRMRFRRLYDLHGGCGSGGICSERPIA